MTRRDEPATPANQIGPETGAAARRPRSVTKGDVPTALLDRYLVERDRQGRSERFYRDHRTTDPVFRDTGRALTATTAYPNAVADMLRIAEHRGWSQLRVKGDEAFRREVWVQAQALGMEVKGYRPRQRDRQAGGQIGQDGPAPAPGLEARLRTVSKMVRALIDDPEVQARLIARARDRAAPYLDRLRSRTRDHDTSPSRGSRSR